VKIFNKLPTNLRCKTLTLTFRVPTHVQRVFFKGQNTNHEVTWNQVRDMTTLSEYV